MRLVRNLLTALGALTLALSLLGLAAMVWAPRWLVVDDVLRPAEAIVVLNGNPARAVRAAELYHRGLAPAVWVGRPESRLPQAVLDLGIAYVPEEQEYRAILLKLGVPDSAIHLYGHGHVSTVEEAEDLRRALGPGPHTLILVTAPAHTRRAKAAIARALPEATLMATPASLEPLPRDWWKERRASLSVVLETVKSVYFHLGGVFRSSDGARDATAENATAAGRP